MAERNKFWGIEHMNGRKLVGRLEERKSGRESKKK